MANEINFRGFTIKNAARPDYWKLIESNSWEPDTFNVLDKYVKSGVTVVDLGAWQGAISIYSRLLGAPTHSIEPDPVAYGQLLNNMEANGMLGDTNAICYNCAISNYEGTAELNSMASEFGNSESSLVHRGFVKTTSTVSVSTLPVFLKDNGIDVGSTDFIKIDIEGGEVDCLRGCIDWVKEVRPTIYLSLHPFWIPEFADFEEWMIGELFPIYKVISSRDLEKELTPEEFRMEINLGQHAFVFQSK